MGKWAQVGTSDEHGHLLRTAPVMAERAASDISDHDTRERERESKKARATRKAYMAVTSLCSLWSLAHLPDHDARARVAPAMPVGEACHE